MVDDREPSLDEMLADPVVLAVMNRDGVSRNALRILIADIRRARRMQRETPPGPDPISGISLTAGVVPCTRRTPGPPRLGRPDRPGPEGTPAGGLLHW